MSTLHYWPEDLASDLPSSPVTVLKEAAAELGQATKGAVEATVRLDSSRSNEGKVEYNFVLVTKALGFRYTLFSMRFDVAKFYPCNVGIPNGNSVNSIIHDEGELREKLTDFLRSEKAVSAVKSLQSLTA